MILGIELGSTRIKSVLTDKSGSVIASGSHEWENQLENGVWTYSIDAIWQGLQSSYADLNNNYKASYGENITVIDAIGISAMMHGYLVFDKDDNLLVPFRTWRNTITAQAADELTEKLNFNIPQRWSVAHHYQAILNGEAHVKDVAFLTTLAGYVHYKLTGKKVLGVGDASGMFPIDNGDYNADMVSQYNVLIKEKGIDADISQLLPKVLMAGEVAGALTKEGAALLDVNGNLQCGAIFCPPEGDAGTGMTATNAVKERTGNVSAGTSAFVMVVMDKQLSKVYKEIDVVTTPAGKPVAMVHVNNFTSEINAWANVFSEVLSLCGSQVNKGELFDKLFKHSAKSDDDCGGLIGYNFLSGEPIAGVETGRPLFARMPEGKLNLANFMQMQIYSALGSLALGMEILKEENVEVEEICGHGGFFKTDYIGANAMSAAVNAPVVTMQNAGEGGAWGIALLALFTLCGGGKLDVFLADIFASAQKTTVVASVQEQDKFANFIKQYKNCLKLEKLSTEIM